MVTIGTIVAALAAIVGALWTYLDRRREVAQRREIEHARRRQAQAAQGVLGTIMQADDAAQRKLTDDLARVTSPGTVASDARSAADVVDSAREDEWPPSRR